jgi:hypothetical protein
MYKSCKLGHDQILTLVLGISLRRKPLDHCHPHTWNDHQLRSREAFASTTRPPEGVSPERTASSSTGRTRNSPRTTRTRRADTIGLVSFPPVALLATSDNGALTDKMRIGYCKRGDKCWFLHVDGSEESGPPGSDAAECIICYDKPVTYGLMGASQRIVHDNFISDNSLDGCSHVLCVQVRISLNSLHVPSLQHLTLPPATQCIRQWRHPNNRTDDAETTNISCPYCRVPSFFVTPSSQFFPKGHPRRAEIVAQYKASMARVPCR